jgi:cell division protease FtsH
MGKGFNQSTQISYTNFHQQVENDNVKSVTVQGDKISGVLKKQAEKVLQAATKNSPAQTKKYTEFYTYLPSFGDNQLLPLLEKKAVTIHTKPQKSYSWLSALLGFLPFIFLIWIGYIFFKRMQGQGQNIFSMGRSKARLYERRKESITFDDVAGAHGAKVELHEIIEFLKDPGHFQRLGGKSPKGVLLVGPPGTGKTLLAKAVAGEAGVPFFSITGSDFMEMFVGVGASRVRNMFNEAKKVSPSIIFIDELDSIGRLRGAGLGGGHDEREQTLNQLLSEMDGFEPNVSVIVMAATNRPDILDPALLRPGRFDRQITVELPTMEDRTEILNIHARNKPLADDADLRKIARGTPGFSGADLENLLNEAAILAARKNKEAIEESDIEEARDKILMGLTRENLGLTEKDRKQLAYHEGGHSVVAAVLPNTDPVFKVTIVPRGRAMGVTQQLPEREKYIYPKEYLLDRLAVMMGGRAAEAFVLGTSTSGAEDDLKQATKLARKMVLDWGMSERMENVALGETRQHVFLGEQISRGREYSEETAREVDEEVHKILTDAYQRAAEVLKKHRGGLDRVAEILLEKEEVTGEEVLKAVGKKKKAERKAGKEKRSAAGEVAKGEEKAEEEEEAEEEKAEGKKVAAGNARVAGDSA